MTHQIVGLKEPHPSESVSVSESESVSVSLSVSESESMSVSECESVSVSVSPVPRLFVLCYSCSSPVPWLFVLHRFPDYSCSFRALLFVLLPSSEHPVTTLNIDPNRIRIRHHFILGLLIN